jgi:hypothetical protein
MDSVLTATIKLANQNILFDFYLRKAAIQPTKAPKLRTESIRDALVNINQSIDSSELIPHKDPQRAFTLQFENKQTPSAQKSKQCDGG